MKTRDKIQQECVDLFRGGNNVFLRHITGLGKTFTMLKMVDGLNVLFFVEKLNQIDNIKKDAEKHKMDVSKITFSHYNSAYKYASKSYDVIILDEADVITEKRVENLLTINCKRFVFATAEISLEKKDLLKLLCKFKEHKVTLSQAIKWGILPYPELRIIEIELGKSKVPVTLYGKRKVEPEMMVPSLLQGEIDFYKTKAVKWSPPDFYAMTALRVGLYRKQWYNSIKLETLARIVDETEGLRRLFFFGNLGDIPDWMPKYHSSDKSTKINYEQFLNGKIDTLANVGMVTRGINVPNIEAGILMTLGKSNVRDTIQKVGRILRSENPLIIIPVIKNTDDEKALNKFLENYVGTIKRN